jgi:hypothetical protein
MHWNILDEQRELDIAALADIGCAKLVAITGRSVQKDYVDLYEILKTISLKELITLYAVKFQDIDTGLVLKSLVYFDDVLQEEIIYKEGHDISFEKVKTALLGQANGYY